VVEVEVVEVEVVEEVVGWFHLILYLVHREVGEGYGAFESLLLYQLRFLFCACSWCFRSL